MTLLEQAKMVVVKTRYDRSQAGPIAQRLAVAIALASHEITGNQATAALGIKCGAITGVCAALIFSALRRGEFKLTAVETPASEPKGE